MNFKNIIDDLSKSIIITTHKDPDVDAIGSSLALYSLLQSLNKNVTLFISDFKISKFDYLPNANKIKTSVSNKNYHTAIYLDCSDKSRIKNLSKFPKTNQIINIDHHQDNTNFGDINIVKEISSVGELLFEEFNKAKITITKDIAICLYAAIIFDTGGFRYANTTSKTLKTASKLIDLNINASLISECVFEKKPNSYFNDIKLGLNNLYTNKEYPFIVIHIPYQKTESYESTIDFFRQYENKELIIVCKETKLNQFKISFRSKQRINTRAIANNFEGGGHLRASGGRFNGSYKSLLTKLIKKASNEFEK